MFTNHSTQSAVTILAAVVSFLSGTTLVAQADEQSEETPVVVVRISVPRLDRFDHSVQQVLKTFELPLPSPLTLAEASGVGQVLDRSGQLSVLVVSTSEAPPTLRLCVEMPVQDFQQFVEALGASAVEEINAVQIAGEQLLVGRSGDAVVLMDVADRATLKKLLAHRAQLDQHQPTWSKWVDEQDVVLEVTPNGVQQLRRFKEFSTPESDHDAAENDLFGDAQDDADDLFGFEDQPLEAHAAAPTKIDGRDAADRALKQLLVQVGRQLVENPLLAAVAEEVEASALGVRHGEHGELAGELRLAWRKQSPLFGMSTVTPVAPPSVFSKQPFVVTGGGSLPGPLLNALTAAYMRQFIKAFDHTQYRETDVEQLQESVLKVADLTTGVAVLQRPTNEEVGVHTNQFLLLRCRDADATMQAVVETVTAWNWLMDNAEGEIMQLGSKELQVQKRDAIQYNADMTAIFAPDPNSLALPEIRAVMEKLFGKDGHFRLLVVRLDKHAVLVACATVKQTEELVAELDASQADANDTLAADRKFQVVLSPHEFSKWAQAAKQVETGDVWGGPIVKIFPESPTVTAVLRVEADGIRVRLELPEGTVRVLGQYIKAHR